MPGTNSGGQLNLFLFECGYVTRNNGRETVTTIGVHPMVVVPESIAYTDTSRSDVTKGTTGDGYHRTVAGRGPWTVTARGSFGVQSRGIGPYVGDGATRFRRFWNEVVRWSDALTTAEARACYEVLTGTPAAGKLFDRFDGERSVPFVNFYDLWNQRSFTVNIDSFGPRRTYRRGAGAGLVEYDLRLREAGPPITSKLQEDVIAPLLAGFVVWSQVNTAIISFDIATIGDLLFTPIAFPTAMFSETLGRVLANIQGATGVMAGKSTAIGQRQPGLGSFLGDAAELALLGQSLVVEAATDIPREPVAPAGAFDFDSLAEDPMPELARLDAIVTVEALAEAASFQLVAGKLYGMSKGQYAAFVASGGLSTGPDVAGTTEHAVGPGDTPGRIEYAYGVAWLDILEANDLLPDEALYPGVKLQIPRVRARGPQRLDGLPVFDSHQGASAWGVDFDVALRDDGQGDFRTVAGPDALVQGAAVLWARLDSELRVLANQSPALAVPEVLAARVSAMLGSDRRIDRIQAVRVSVTDARIEAFAELRAINGAVVTVSPGAMP